jgi:hypothetical protein
VRKIQREEGFLVEMERENRGEALDWPIEADVCGFAPFCVERRERRRKVVIDVWYCRLGRLGKGSDPTSFNG